MKKDAQVELATTLLSQAVGQSWLWYCYHTGQFGLFAAVSMAAALVLIGLHVGKVIAS